MLLFLLERGSGGATSSHTADVMTHSACQPPIPATFRFYTKQCQVYYTISTPTSLTTPTNIPPSLQQSTVLILCCIEYISGGFRGLYFICHFQTPI